MCGIVYWPAAHLRGGLVLWEAPTLLERDRNSVLTGYYKIKQFLLFLDLVLFRMHEEASFFSVFHGEKTGLLRSVWRGHTRGRKECSPRSAEATPRGWGVCCWVPAPISILTCLRAMTFPWKQASQELGIARQRNAFFRVRSPRIETLLGKPGWQCSLPMSDAEKRVHQKILTLRDCQCWHTLLSRRSFKRERCAVHLPLSHFSLP